MMLFTASKAYLCHPEVPYPRENPDFVYTDCGTISCARRSVWSRRSLRDDPFQPARHLTLIHPWVPWAIWLKHWTNSMWVKRRWAETEIIFAVSLQRLVMIKLQKFNEQVIQFQLEERLESIISGAALLANSLCTREERRNRIVPEWDAVRQALQDLLDEYVE